MRTRRLLHDSSACPREGVNCRTPGSTIQTSWRPSEHSAIGGYALVLNHRGARLLPRHPLDCSGAAVRGHSFVLGYSRKKKRHSVAGIDDPASRSIARSRVEAPFVPRAYTSALSPHEPNDDLSIMIRPVGSCVMNLPFPGLGCARSHIADERSTRGTRVLGHLGDGSIPRVDPISRPRRLISSRCAWQLRDSRHSRDLVPYRPSRRGRTPPLGRHPPPSRTCRRRSRIRRPRSSCVSALFRHLNVGNSWNVRTETDGGERRALTASPRSEDPGFREALSIEWFGADRLVHCHIATSSGFFNPLSLGPVPSRVVGRAFLRSRLVMSI